MSSTKALLNVTAGKEAYSVKSLQMSIKINLILFCFVVRRSIQQNLPGHMEKFNYLCSSKHSLTDALISCLG